MNMIEAYHRMEKLMLLMIKLTMIEEVLYRLQKMNLIKKKISMIQYSRMVKVEEVKKIEVL